jgi:hypothetical protein
MAAKAEDVLLMATSKFSLRWRSGRGKVFNWHEAFSGFEVGFGRGVSLFGDEQRVWIGAILHFVVSSHPD